MISQLKAEWVGSKSHHHPSEDSASGMNQGTSSMPRHLRWPLTGKLLTRWAVISPIVALSTTAESAKIADCHTTIQNTSRESRKRKLPSPMKRVCVLFRVDR